MKKTLLFLMLIVSGYAFSQTTFPEKINYQAVLRDVSGNVLAPATNAQLKFKIYNTISSPTVAYEEDHNVTTDQVGMVNVRIGTGTPITGTITNVSWRTGDACYEVFLNGTQIGTRQGFASAPYAYYAKFASGSVDPGTINQTVYWDASLSKWKPTNNLSNDGNRVSIGMTNIFPRRKFHVFSSDPLDSSVIFSRKLNAGSGDAAFRGSSEGLVNFNGTASLSVIFGADIKALNFGTGYGVGVAGSAATTTSGTAIGTSGVASGPMGSTLIGVYASADTTSGNPNSVAAFFDQGKVIVGGSIYFQNSNAPAGSVYKIDAQRKGYWGVAGASPNLTLTQSGIVSIISSPPSNYTIGALAPTFTSSGIGSITLGSYPNYLLNIPTPTLNFNGSSGLFSYNQAPITSTVNLSPLLTLVGNTLSVAGSSINLGPLGLWARPTLTATELANIGDNVGIGAPNPTEKLSVQTAGNTDISIISAPLNVASLNLGSTTNHFFGRISYNTNFHTMSFWTNNTADRIFINGGGNVGIGNSVPNQKLDVTGNVIVPAANDYLYAGTKTYYVNLNPSALQYAGSASGVPQLSTVGDQINLDGSGASVIGYFAAPLSLPNNATITSVSGYINDPSAAPNDYVTIYVQQIVNSSGAITTLGNAGTTGPGTTIGFQNQTAGMSSVVDNNLNSYCISVTMGNNTLVKLRNMKITYVVNKAD